MELPKELIDAKQMLAEAETVKNLERKISLFKEGIDILDDYLEEYPDGEYVYVIHNIITSYTRVMIKQAIQAMREGQFEFDNFSRWLEYLLLFISKVEKYVNKCISDDSELETGYDEFKKLHAQEFRELLKEQKLI